jgi:CheY-like chemotaxis protein
MRRHFLERAGYEVVMVASSEALLERLRVATPALLVIDVLVDGLNGFELCRRVREHFRAEELPIVLGSEVYSADIFRAEAERVGAQAYLTEPRDLDELLGAVDRVAAPHAALREQNAV